MSDPSLAPSPFNPRPAAPSQGGGGCRKAAFVGCGGLLLLLVICAVVFVVKASAIVEWGLRIVEDKVVTVMPDDTTPAERADLRQGFADFRAMFREHRQPDPRRLQAFQTQLMQIVGKPKGQVTRQEIRDLARALELVSGKTPPALAPEAPEAPGGTSPAPEAAPSSMSRT